MEVLEVQNDDFGWSAILPGYGLLEEFKGPYLYKWGVPETVSEYDTWQAPGVTGTRG